MTTEVFRKLSSREKFVGRQRKIKHDSRELSYKSDAGSTLSIDSKCLKHSKIKYMH